MGLLSNITKAFTTPGASASDSTSKLGSEGAQLFAYKQMAIAQARATAQESGRAASLEDYRQACIALGEKNNLNPAQWNAKIYADVSGQDLSGFAISEPSKTAPSKSVTADLWNQDSDGCINDFYTNIDFTGANLKDCYVQPATSFNEEIARAKTLEGITFDGMENGDRFVFGGGQYNDIKLTNINGGELVFGKNTQVSNLEIEGKTASVTVEPNAIISNMSVNNDFRIVTLDMGKGATIANSDLREATISMASNLKGSVWQNVQLGGNLSGVDFSGATMKNMKINGQAITKPEQLKAFGATVDAQTKVSASEDFVKQVKVEQALAQASKVAKDVASWMNAPAVTKPEQHKAPAPEMKSTAMVDGSLSHYEAMNKDMTKAPERTPEQLAAAQQNAANPEKTPETKEVAAKPKAAPAKAESYDMSYYARMSANNGRSLT